MLGRIRLPRCEQKTCFLIATENQQLTCNSQCLFCALCLSLVTLDAFCSGGSTCRKTIRTTFGLGTELPRTLDFFACARRVELNRQNLGEGQTISDSVRLFDRNL